MTRALVLVVAACGSPPSPAPLTAGDHGPATNAALLEQ